LGGAGVLGTGGGRGFVGGKRLPDFREPLILRVPLPLPLSGEEEDIADCAERGINCEAILSSNEVAFVSFFPAMMSN
jgi:hypothetical protein